MNPRRVLSNKTAVRLAVACIYMSILILVGTVLFSNFEGLSYGDSFYLTIQTMFSIGYGDIPPTTVDGKILTTLLIIFGISGFLAAVGIIGTSIFRRYSREAVRLTEHLLKVDDEKKEAAYRWADGHGIDRKYIDRAWSKQETDEPR